ncbi:DUF502 domain-containing protein [uncultured Abyssibacter sp.]|uniref:DUF502 domain-containing protein n=1 Tax=uncultured Abyssibacter sp. TaxID=2320202 RepID=UPI0032B288BE
MKRLFQRWLLAGVVIWLPIVTTIFAVRFLLDLLDHSLAWLPASWQPENWLGFSLPGLGLVFSLVVVLATGALAANWLGLKLLGIGESLVERLPLVRSIYKAMKRVAETVFSEKGNAFREVLLLEYPRPGLWAIGFRTGEAPDEVDRHVGRSMATVYIPTTPNPTSGFVVMAAEDELIRLHMPVEDALQLIISMGAVRPEAASRQPPPIDAAQPQR